MSYLKIVLLGLFFLLVLMAVTACSREDPWQKPAGMKTRCIDGATYESLPYGNFLITHNGHYVPCK